MKIYANLFGVHERALKLRSQRMEVLAQNIANADTPHFKARDVDFKKVLDQTRQAENALRVTHAGHYPLAQDTGGSGLLYRVPFNVASDGNTVEISVEQAKYGQAAADYQATLSFLERRVSGVRKALKGE